MPIKIDTRKKTRKQKEKNKRRKKRNQSRKGQEQFKRIQRSLNQMTGHGSGGEGPNRGGARSRRRSRPSMQAIHGVVANAYASRMPVGSNHVKGIYANTQTGLSSKDFFKRTLREMRRAQIPDQASLPPTYSYQNRPPAIYPESIHVQPIGLAEPTKSLHNALRAVAVTSMPRGYRQSLIREATAQPISTGLAEPGMPNWGQMYEATEEGRAHVTRAMTADELRKEDNYTRVQAVMRTGGPGPTMGIWAPTRVRTSEDVSPRGSDSSRESARRDGRRRLSMAEEHAFLTYYPPRTDLVALAKIHGPEGAPARAQIRELINAVFSNANSSRNTESYAESYASGSGNTAEMLRSINLPDLTDAELAHLEDLGLEHLAPGPEIQGYDRNNALRRIREVFEGFPPNSNGSMSTIHTEYSNADDPLHLTAGEILLLRRQGPEGVEHIRLATSFASEQSTRDQVAQARAFLASLQRSRSRSRSGSRSTLSRGSNGSDSTGSMLRAYQATHAAAFPNGSEGTSSSGSLGSVGSLEQLESVGSSGARSVSTRGSRGSRSSRGSRG